MKKITLSNGEVKFVVNTLQSLFFNEIEIFLTQEAYINEDCNGTPYYFRAHAIDLDLNDYQVKWNVINVVAEDDSDACNWEEYSVKTI